MESQPLQGLQLIITEKFFSNSKDINALQFNFSIFVGFKVNYLLQRKICHGYIFKDFKLVTAEKKLVKFKLVTEAKNLAQFKLVTAEKNLENSNWLLQRKIWKIQIGYCREKFGIV